ETCSPDRAAIDLAAIEVGDRPQFGRIQFMNVLGFCRPEHDESRTTRDHGKLLSPYVSAAARHGGGAHTVSVPEQRQYHISTALRQFRVGSTLGLRHTPPDRPSGGFSAPHGPLGLSAAAMTP